MSNSTQRKASPLAEGIMDLVVRYGEAARSEEKGATPSARFRARIASQELFAEIGEALRTHRFVTPGLGDELDRQFGTQDNGDLDYGPNPGPSVGLPPYVTAEVVEQSPGRAITLLQFDDERAWVAYGVGGMAPSWLAEVPVGKALLLRASFDSASVEWTLTDWVEPAADHCSPRPNDVNNWVIGDDTCAEEHLSIYPDGAVELHNAWLHSVWARPSVGPAPATASDLAASFPADPHAVAAMGLTPTGQLAEPVTVSPERVSIRRALELCRELNDFPSPGAADAHLRSAPEFGRVLNADEHGRVFDAELVDGSTITNSANNGWVWSR